MNVTALTLTAAQLSKAECELNKLRNTACSWAELAEYLRLTAVLNEHYAKNAETLILGEFAHLAPNSAEQLEAKAAVMEKKYTSIDQYKRAAMARSYVALHCMQIIDRIKTGGEQQHG